MIKRLLQKTAHNNYLEVRWTPEGLEVYEDGARHLGDGTDVLRMLELPGPRPCEPARMLHSPPEGWEGPK